jgi:hypothetical protein
MPRRLHLVSLLCLAAGGLALAGCATAPPRPTFPPITFAQVAPIKLDVREIEVERAYQPPHAAPNVEHLFAVPPAVGAKLWATDRLTAAGPMGRARFVVRDASVLETPLKQSGGLTGAFTIEQSERYDARLVVEIEIFSEAGLSAGAVTAEVTHSRTVPENLTLGEREQVWHEMTRAMLDELDAQLDKTIKEAFYAYLIL